MLTKLDGDSRGGAALSVKAVTGCPIKFVGVGEKLAGLDALRPRPDGQSDPRHGRHRRAGREGAEPTSTSRRRKDLADKLKSGNRFDLNDFLRRLAQMKKMGGLSSLIDKLPAQFQQAAGRADMNKAERTSAGCRASSTR